jgi:hypothetical protein
VKHDPPKQGIIIGLRRHNAEVIDEEVGESLSSLSEIAASNKEVAAFLNDPRNQTIWHGMAPPKERSWNA